MTRNSFKAFLMVAALAGTLGLASKAEAGFNTGYLCLVQVSGRGVFMTIYNQPGCTGGYLGSGTMFAPGVPSGSVVNYWPTQSRFDLMTSELINNRWSKITLEVDTGAGRNNAISSITFPQD